MSNYTLGNSNKRQRRAERRDRPIAPARERWRRHNAGGGTLAVMTQLVGTRARAAAFIEELARHGLMGRACTASGLSPSTAYRMRREDPDFAQAWSDALQNAADELEAEARRRALHGNPEVVVHKGSVVFKIDPLTGEVERDAAGNPVPLTVNKSSDRMLEVMLQAKRPDEFGRKTQVSVDARVRTRVGAELPLDVSRLTAEQRAQLREILLAMGAAPAPVEPSPLLASIVEEDER